MPGGGSGEALKMIVDEEYFEKLGPALSKKGEKPGEGPGGEDEKGKPEVHPENLLEVPVEGEKGEHRGPRYDDADKALHIKGERREDVAEAVQEEPLTAVGGEIGGCEESEGEDHEESEGAIHDDPVGYPEIFP